jgi:hypothetical protein
MFVPDGGSLKRDFGHRSLIEPDLMVVVKDAGIMDATTELEAAAPPSQRTTETTPIAHRRMRLASE